MKSLTWMLTLSVSKRHGSCGTAQFVRPPHVFLLGTAFLTVPAGVLTGGLPGACLLILPSPFPRSAPSRLGNLKGGPHSIRANASTIQLHLLFGLCSAPAWSPDPGAARMFRRLTAPRPHTAGAQRFEAEYRSQFTFPDAFLEKLLLYVGGKKGKRLRPMLYLLVQGAVSPGSERDVSVAVLIEMLHTASLLHDDVVDGTEQRRGERILNALVGNQLSVLAGDFMMATALNRALSMPYPDVVPVLSRVLVDMTRSELQQAEMERTQAVSESKYLDIVFGKTASLFESSCELGAAVQNAGPDRVSLLRRFGRHFGTAYQILDDIQDITGDAEAIGKPVGQDLGNGKWTLPLILAVDRCGDSERAQFFERMGRFSADDRAWIGDFIRRQGGMEAAKVRAEAEIGKPRFCSRRFRLRLDRGHDEPAGWMPFGSLKMRTDDIRVPAGDPSMRRLFHALPILVLAVCACGAGSR
jgi:octaprenyl-diphosphate synthase